MSETLGYSKRKSYICIARIRHASRRTAYQGGTFFIYTFMDYTNSPLEVPALIQTLKDRGLSITDDNKALAFLENVSYFRFRTYLRPMEQDTVTHQYKSGASFGKEYGIIEFNSAVEGMYINGEGSGDPATVNAVYYQIDGRKIIFKNSALVGSWTIMEKSKNRIVLQAYLPQEYKVILTKKY